MTESSSETRGERVVSGLAAINEVIETDKRTAWLLFAGSLAAMAACWFVVLFASDVVLPNETDMSR